MTSSKNIDFKFKNYEVRIGLNNKILIRQSFYLQ